ncbi:MAG TPA: hypothetical protein VNZ93_09820 [Pseudorhodoplanes sp.]|nr:hypothetical protein [Pseudorhodoplanes sp.]
MAQGLFLALKRRKATFGRRHARFDVAKPRGGCDQVGVEFAAIVAEGFDFRAQARFILRRALLLGPDRREFLFAGLQDVVVDAALELRFRRCILGECGRRAENCRGKKGTPRHNRADASDLPAICVHSARLCSRITAILCLRLPDGRL